jgi:hypothetical protein
MIVFGEAYLLLSREFIASSTKMPRSIGRLSASALSSPILQNLIFGTHKSRQRCRRLEALFQMIGERQPT